MGEGGARYRHVKMHSCSSSSNGAAVDGSSSERGPEGEGGGGVQV